MSRATDALSCGLAIALAVLGASAIKPVFHALGVGREGAFCAAGVRGLLRREPPFGGARRVRILLIGADQRAGDTGRSDSLLLLFVNPQTGYMAILGLPRDLRVSIPGRGHDKINHAYAFGGPELTKRTVEAFLGHSVDYYALVFFSGFVEAVDALGGVEIEVPEVEGGGRGMNYDDNADTLHIHLKPGLQHLNGQQALGYVRYRKSNIPGLGDGDEARSARQQQFLKAMAEQHLSVISLPRLMAAAKTVAENVETDLSPAEITDLVRVLHACDPSQILTLTVPLRSSNWRPGTPFYTYADTTKLREVLARIEWHLEAGPEPRPTVEVLNACGISGRAADAGEKLAERGFRITRCANADTYGVKRTVVEYRQGYERPARLAASVLACGKLRRVGEPSGSDGTDNSVSDLRVYVGRDYDPRAAQSVAGG